MIEVKRQIDEISYKSYSFHFFDNYGSNTTLVLNDVSIVTKKSKKHKEVIETLYDRLSKRNSKINEEDIELTDDIKKEAIENFVSKIKVLKWSEYK